MYTKTSDEFHIIATSVGLMISGPSKERVKELFERIERAIGRYCLYPDRIKFHDEEENKETNKEENEEHHQNQKTSFWRKLFGY